jgi:Flp pilus assembly protein TadG
MYALMAPMLVFASGAAIDYGRATQIQSKLNAAADAAALAALTPAILQQDATTAKAAAESMFYGLADGVTGLTGTSATANVSNGATALVRMSR